MEGETQDLGVCNIEIESFDMEGELTIGLVVHKILSPTGDGHTFDHLSRTRNNLCYEVPGNLK